MLQFEQDVFSNNKMGTSNTAQEQICQTDKRKHTRSKWDARFESRLDNQLQEDGNRKNTSYRDKAPIIDVVAAEDDDEAGDLKTENNVYSRIRDERDRYNNEKSAFCCAILRCSAVVSRLRPLALSGTTFSWRDI